MSEKTDRWFFVLAAIWCIAGYAFVLHANFPGYLSADAVGQIHQALSGSYDDWQSPFPKLLLSVLFKIALTPAGFMAFANALIWGGILFLAVQLRRRLGAVSCLLLLVPLLPGTFNLLGHILYDTLLASWLLAASAAAWAAGGGGRSPAWGRGFQWLANCLLVCAFLTKPNVIFSLIPLILYANRALRLRWNLVVSICLLLAMPFIGKAQNALIGVQKTNVANSILVHQLLGLSYYEQKNLFPGKWTDQQARRIVTGCYSPVQWDTAWTGQCGFIFKELKNQDLWGKSSLARAWVDAMVRHPDNYFNVLGATFKLSVFQPNSPTMRYPTDNPWHLKVADDPPRDTTLWATEYVESDVNLGASKPWLFALVSCLAIIFLLRTGRADSPEGLFALVVLLSGLIYLLTYFFFNVSTEYRYFYWCGFASYLGGLVAILARRPDGAAVATPRGVRVVALMIAALAAALVFAPFAPPMQSHTVTVTPLDDKPVLLASTRNAATPPWMHQPFQGAVYSTSWHWVGEGFRSSLPYSPFIVQLDMLAQDIDVVLATGPGMGRAQVETIGFRQNVDTATNKSSSMKLVLPARPLVPLASLMGVSENFWTALGGFLLILTLSIWLTSSHQRASRLTSPEVAMRPSPAKASTFCSMSSGS